MLELISPAASPESVIAALQSGADSIYIGFGGADDGAFTQDDFAKAVRYCRVRGCKVYAELDRFFPDEELEAAAQLGLRSAELGVAGVVVQDLGLIPVLRRVVPDMPLIAGERLGLHNLAGIEAMAQLGVKRVRVPMEMTLAEISAIAAISSVELEATVFDAACFARAGTCYLGAMTDRHTVSRGGCSALCRDQYSMGGRMDDRPMCLKDVSLLPYLKELEEAGVKCVRIGRSARRSEATALVTAVCRRCIKDGRPPNPGELEQLDTAFSHREFTDGGLHGQTEELFGVYPPADRDAEKLFTEVRKGYAGGELRRVPVGFYAVIMKQSAVRITAQDAEGNRTSTFGPRPTLSPGRGLTEREVESELFKTGGTPYLCAGVRTLMDSGVTLPENALADMRRTLLRQLTEKRSVVPAVRKGSFPQPPSSKKLPPEQKLIFQVSAAEQLSEELAAMEPAAVYVPLELLISDFDRLRPFTERGCVPACVMPRIITDREAGKVYELLGRARALGVTEALCANLGHIALARRAGMTVRGDFGLNLYNSFAMDLAERAGLISVTASFELKLSQIVALSKPLDTELIIYGRVPVMISDRCVIKNSASRCVCGNPQRLSNNTGGVFPVVREFGCRNAVLASAKLYLADLREQYELSGIRAVRLIFTTESPRECAEVVRGCTGRSEYRPNGLTRGPYGRGVD